MSAIRGLARRPTNAATVLLQGRVSPDAREAIKAAATASGVSIAYYLEALILTMDREGTLPVIDRPRPQNEELPISAA